MTSTWVTQGMFFFAISMMAVVTSGAARAVADVARIDARRARAGASDAREGSVPVVHHEKPPVLDVLDVPQFTYSFEANPLVESL